MRKLIVTNIVSLDGSYEGPGRDVMVLPMDHSFDAYNVERLREADILLLGRNSYELFRGFWPAMADKPDATPAHRELSRLENAIDKVVVSDSISMDQTEPWRETTRIVRRADAHEQIAELKRRPRPGHPGLRQPNALERPAGRRPGRRAPPDRRVGRRRRGHSGLRHPAGRPAPAARHPNV